MLGIVGESGSGKSLTLRAILQLLPSRAQATAWRGGAIAICLACRRARSARSAAREIAMIFQEPMTALDPVLPIGLQITESLAEHRALRGAAARRRAIELLDLVGIPDAPAAAGQFPARFSGGMRQRAMIAIALAAEPQAAAGR